MTRGPYPDPTLPRQPGSTGGRRCVVRRSRLLAAGLTATMLVVPLVGVSASAADADRYGGGRGHGHGNRHEDRIDDLTKVASGLASQRRLDADSRVDVYVALSGRGTDVATPGTTAEEASTLDLPCFTGSEVLTCFWDSGA